MAAMRNIIRAIAEAAVTFYGIVFVWRGIDV